MLYSGNGGNRYEKRITAWIAAFVIVVAGLPLMPGTVLADTTTTVDGGAGIGGSGVGSPGRRWGADGGEIKITGGTVEATSIESGAGIGAGHSFILLF